MRLSISIVLGAALMTSAAVAGQKFNVVPLVSDQAGIAAHTDPNLINPWGLAYVPGGPAWISDNGTNLATVYDRSTGNPSALVVNIPGQAPSGQVANTSSGFKVTENGKSGAALFIFATLTGTIEGWSPSVDGKNAVIAVDDSGEGAVYTGLAIDSTLTHLYAANFTKNEVSVYDNTFTETGSFTDKNLPKNYAPFNVAVLNGKVYVAFAKRKKSGDEKHGKGLGYVDVFDLSGNLQKQLIATGDLNAPWGMTIAPSGFGGLDGKLLVGNFGDGSIHAYDVDSGAEVATLKGADGKTLKIDGLWTIDAGPGSNVAFTAGPDDETHGLYGLIQAAN
ncbi:MAG: TIGR03118 family protein [Alphaproteobacteria bacterium]|nr:TIGR03118 family protein [Alphaproteobacteria bacterium]MBV9063429.1 TIGR03118 family protein [Alphaproteobacteria bacterium]